MSETYLRFPLALILTSGSSGDFFNKATAFAVVNAGLGFERNRSQIEWEKMIEDLPSEKVSLHALVGAKLLRLSLGDKSGLMDEREYRKIMSDCSGSPVISMPSDHFWTAAKTQQYVDGIIDQAPDRMISWREFRILLAVSSLPYNTRKFSVAGWESISRRACGFHTKKDFNAFEESDSTSWREHFAPLSRYQTTTTLDKLESLRFFIRHRISKGAVGGMTAYSFRHDARSALAKDCADWQAFNSGEQVRETRSEDHLLHAKEVQERKERRERNHAKAASILNASKSPEVAPVAKPDLNLIKKEKPPLEPLKHSKPASTLQVPCKSPASTLQGTSQGTPQGTSQHNEIFGNEIFGNERYPNDIYSNLTGGEEGMEEDWKGDEIIEYGYTHSGRFILGSEASTLMASHPDSWNQFTKAQRITGANGKQVVEMK